MRTYGAIRELAPTPEQIATFQRIVGANRFAQNWAIQYVKDCLDLGIPVDFSFYSLRKQFNEVKDNVCVDKETGERWDLEVPERALSTGIERAADSLKNFFDSRSGKRGGAPVGFPRFRSRGQSDSSKFPDRVNIKSREVYFRKVGWVALKEGFTLPEEARLTGCVLRERAGRWFITLLVREDAWETPEKKQISSAVGIDLGVGDHFAVLSDGTKIGNPRFFRTDENLIKRRSRQVSRKQKGSANQRKAVQRLARTHYNVANRRRDFLHKLSNASGREPRPDRD